MSAITISFCPLHGHQITDSQDCPVTVGKDYCREPWLSSVRYVPEGEIAAIFDREVATAEADYEPDVAWLCALRAEILGAKAKPPEIKPLSLPENPRG